MHAMIYIVYCKVYLIGSIRYTRGDKKSTCIYEPQSYYAFNVKYRLQRSWKLYVNFVNFFCPPPFRRKAEGHGFWLSVIPSVRPSVLPSFRPPIGVCTLCAHLLLQFYSNSFETLQMSLLCFEDMHVIWI